MKCDNGKSPMEVKTEKTCKTLGLRIATFDSWGFLYVSKRALLLFSGKLLFS